jgi:hypothetical protein
MGSGIRRSLEGAVIRKPSKRALRKYIKELRLWGLSDAEIDHELKVDPESPIIRVEEYARRKIFGDIEPRTRAQLEEELRIEENVGFSRWITTRDDDVCRVCAEREGRELPDTLWESIGKPPWSECTAEHCRCRLVRVERL